VERFCDQLLGYLRLALQKEMPTLDTFYQQPIPRTSKMIMVMSVS
jgi:hypothetical protein